MSGARCGVLQCADTDDTGKEHHAKIFQYTARSFFPALWHDSSKKEQCFRSAICNEGALAMLDGIRPQSEMASRNPSIPHYCT